MKFYKNLTVLLGFLVLGIIITPEEEMSPPEIDKIEQALLDASDLSFDFDEVVSVSQDGDVVIYSKDGSFRPATEVDFAEFSPPLSISFDDGLSYSTTYFESGEPDLLISLVMGNYLEIKQDQRSNYATNWLGHNQHYRPLSSSGYTVSEIKQASKKLNRPLNKNETLNLRSS